MRSRTFHLLSTTFTIAIAGCKKEPLPRPTVDASVTAVEGDSMPRLAPNEKRLGQSCAGSIIDGLSPGTPVDYLAFYVSGLGTRVGASAIAGSKGEPCKRAKNVAGCRSALAGLATKPTNRTEYLVYTRGDEVGTVEGDSVGPFLAPIESVEEAAFTLSQSYNANRIPGPPAAPCEPAAFRKVGDKYEATFTKVSYCEMKHTSDYAVAVNGVATMVKTSSTPPKKDCYVPVPGRCPEGLALEPRTDTMTLGGYFAEATELEAASVHAFRRLDVDLARQGAPSSLQRRAKRAARDEARHARDTAVLARRFGGTPRNVHVEPIPARSLVDVAIENAVEGCVLETWAALVARWQADNASDAYVRATMKGIARDETRHAALAWDVADWLESKLAPSERTRVHEARETAARELVARLDAEWPDEIRDVAGLPSAPEAIALYAAWSNAWCSTSTT